MGWFRMDGLYPRPGGSSRYLPRFSVLVSQGIETTFNIHVIAPIFKSHSMGHRVFFFLFLKCLVKQDRNPLSVRTYPTAPELVNQIHTCTTSISTTPII